MLSRLTSQMSLSLSRNIPSWVKTKCFRVVDVGANKSKRKECTCLFCQKAIRDERKALEDHIKQDCTKVTREIKTRVSETVGSKVPDVTPPTAKRQKPTPGKPGHYAALEVPSTSKTTPALQKVSDRKFVRMLVMNGTPFAFANNPFTYDFNRTMRPDYEIPGEHICYFVVQLFTQVNASLAA